ncbi:hypothetical protein OG331_16860 [Streptomyces sp. NBC_01017]|uniref:hypothetical protein n=1 Tax=Streptomyces sp. NBC_01017 TaxID=2903721 RepID=UPI003865D17A|nr:hypothetical protein OG331_16860 [Streptomyces sp. NBC_01017]
MAENEDEALDGDEAVGADPAGPAGPFLRDFNTLTDGFPKVSPRSALVQFYRNGGYTVKRASGVQHVDRPVLARTHSMCEIALGTYVTPLQMELPAAGGTTFFKAEVDIQWAVTDPHLAALEVVTDVANRLTSPVLERLREVTTTYRVTEAEQANRAITRECAGGRWADLGSELGLRVRLYVRLRVDDRTIEHADEERDAHAQAKVIRLRQESYRRMLQGGELEQLSFMLAADPEGAKDFLEKIRQEGRQDEKDRVARLFAMASRGELATVDVETQVLNLLNQGDGRPMVGPIGTVPARRPRELEASSGRPFNPDWASDEPPRRRPQRAEPSRGEPDRRSDGRGADRRGPDRRDPDRTEPYRGGEGDYDADYDAEYATPGTRSRRASQRPAPYPDDDPVHDDGRAPGRRRTHRPDPYPDDDRDHEDRRVPARRPTYRPEPYSPRDDADYDDPRSRTPRQTYRPEPYSPRDEADYDDPRVPARQRTHRPEPYPGADPQDDDPRSRTPRQTYRPEPYYPQDEPEYDDPRTRADRRPTHRPELYPVDDDREPPRRRRAEDDGWSWAEEDR